MRQKLVSILICRSNKIVSTELKATFSTTDHQLSSHFVNVTNNIIRACLHRGRGPQIGEVTCDGSPHLSCKHDQIKMRDYIDRLAVTSPKRVTSLTRGPPPQYKQALRP